MAAAALAVAPATGAPAKAKKAKSFSCTIENYQLGQPTPANPTAVSLGFVSCPKPFGEGLHYNRTTITKMPAPGVPGTATGTFKNYYNRGTTRGTAALTIVPSSPMNITYTGTVTYTGGTGKFKRVRGGGTIVCTTTDGGAHRSCTVKSKLTGV
ncbi:MAG: hypothetical protein ACRDLS_12650 [Solirubrobacteraceae bacterium]